MKDESKETKLKENISSKMRHEANVSDEVMVLTCDAYDANSILQLNMMNEIEKLKQDMIKLTKQGVETMDKVEIILGLLKEK